MTVAQHHTTPSANPTTGGKTIWLVMHMRNAGTRAMFVAAFGISTASVAMAQPVDIQPQDGQWRSVISVEQASGCSPDMQAEIESEALANQGGTRFVAFSRPLNGADLNRLVDTEMTWQRIDSNHWVGRLREAETTFMGRIESRIDTVLQVSSAHQIAQSVLLQISLPPLIARQIGSQELCQMELQIQHDRLGD